jgi:hypothetical protein
MIEVGTRLQNNETGAIVTVLKTEYREVRAGLSVMRWVYYVTPAIGTRGGRLVRIAANRIFPLPADGRARKKGYTAL